MNFRSGMGVVLFVAATLTLPILQETATAKNYSQAVMLVVDNSGSMSENDRSGVVKLSGARRAISSVLDAIPTDTLIGLRTYPAPGANCGAGTIRAKLLDDSGLRTELGVIDRESRAMTANGETPTAEALQAGADDLQEAGFGKGGVIILISDGEWNCDSDPCEVARKIETSGIDITVNTVGFDLDPDSQAVKSLQCVADATGGVYRDAEDAAELADELQRLTQGEIVLEVKAPAIVENSIGAGSRSTVRIEAIVNSVGVNDALDVTAYLSFTGDRRPSSVKPTFRLGSIAAGNSATAVWEVPVPASFTDIIVEYTVTIYGPQIQEVSRNGSITFRGQLGIEDAGPLLRNVRNPVIMGDSYSAGEGGGSYDPETNTSTNSCHRSANTWGRSIFPNLVNIACSGAHIPDVTTTLGKQVTSNKVEPQVLQLKNLSQPADLVLLTLGGNDAGFAEVIFQCIAGWKGGLDLRPSDCHLQDVPVAGECKEDTEQLDLGQLADLITPLPEKQCIYKAGTFGDVVKEKVAGLHNNLILAYQEIDSVLNSDEWIERRGGAEAPIVVMAYPSLAPDPERYEEVLQICPKAMSFEEWKFVTVFANALNSSVRSAVTGAQAEGIPIHFVEEGAKAFLPNHSLCDGPDSFANYIDLDETIWGLYVAGNTWLGGNVFFPFWERTLTVPGAFAYKEAFHPNANGYKALTQALVQWSTTTSVQEKRPRQYRSTTNTPISGPEIRPELGVTIEVAQGGSGTLVVSSDPNSLVKIEVLSSPRLIGTAIADETGIARVDFRLPVNFALGEHKLRWMSYRSGIGLYEEQNLLVVRLAEPWKWLIWPSLAILLAGVVIFGVALRQLRASRRISP